MAQKYKILGVGWSLDEAFYCLAESEDEAVDLFEYFLCSHFIRCSGFSIEVVDN